MRIGATGGTPDVPQPAAPTSEAAREPANAPSFSAVLAQRLREPRDQIELTREAMRATIAEARSGASLLPTSGPPLSVGVAGVAHGLPGPLGRAGAEGDPFGWRSLTRTLGDRVVAPGFGDVFEAQIQQESGFDPEVAFGYRRSSAGAEGIAQLMPQYYQGVNRRDPEASLKAAAESMRHYLAANNGDIRRALASYNAGLGTVQSLVAAHGENWERGLPSETKQYLAAIVGGAKPALDVRGDAARPFGGRGPHGVLTPPVAGSHAREVGDALEWAAAPLASVRAPADGVVTVVGGAGDTGTLALDHGNGWTSLLEGLGAVDVARGAMVQRGQTLGALPDGEGSRPLRLMLALRGQPTSAAPYVITGG